MGKLDARDMKSLIVAGLVLMAASLAEADDGDGDTDLVDLGILLANFGATCP